MEFFHIDIGQNGIQAYGFFDRDCDFHPWRPRVYHIIVVEGVISSDVTQNNIRFYLKLIKINKYLTLPMMRFSIVI